tara:strand:- start:1130 stop:2071 length:942 start_codon:yes stop_codon:yes gene_type:complete
MSSSFPAQVLQQAQYDARIGGQGMDRNPFQRAQDFLRNKLQPAINPSAATPTQQTDIDARNAKKAIEELQKAKNVKQLRQLGQTGGQLFGLGRQLITGGSQLLVGDGSHLPLLAAMQTSNAIDTFKSKPRTTTKTEIDPKLFPKAVEGGYSISPKVRKELAEERSKSNPDPAPTSDPTPSGAKLDPNATEEFKTAFNAGNNNMDQIQAMYADGPKYKDTDKTALQVWAEANPALAQKEYLKKAFNTDGTPKILDKTAEGFDKPNAPGVVESIDGMQLPNSISINAANELLDNMSEADDSQAFLKNYIMAMQNN